MDTSKKIENFAIVFIALALIWFITLLICNMCAAKTSDDADSKQIADYEYQMNELRKQKEKCYDDLTWQETQDYLNWFTKPCVQYDEQIMELREKADNLKSKSYDKLGLK